MLLLTAEPITYFQAIVLGLLEGFSELFPISSLGHSVILPRLLGWNIHQNDEYFITFLIATHLATAIVLFIFFFQDWMRIFAGMWRSLADRQIAPENHDAKLGWLLVVGTVPAGLLGLLFQDSLRTVFASAQSAQVAGCWWSATTEWSGPSGMAGSCASITSTTSTKPSKLQGSRSKRS